MLKIKLLPRSSNFVIGINQIYLKVFETDLRIMQQEENNKLKIQNEELGAKLRRSEIFLSRVKEELGSLRVSAGFKSCIDFEEEQRLMIKLKVGI